jgi:hypothetical protein
MDPNSGMHSYILKSRASLRKAVDGYIVYKKKYKRLKIRKILHKIFTKYVHFQKAVSICISVFKADNTPTGLLE